MITREQFINLEKRRIRRKEEAEVTETTRDGHKRHVQRRWAVRLWNLNVESLIRDDCHVFINIDWGGDREEARIRTGEGTRWWQFLSDSEVVWGMGAEPLSLRSDAMELEEKGKVAFQNEFEFEWRGSYADLETQSMIVQLWRYNQFRANTLDSNHKSTLLSYATGPVFQEIELVRANIATTDGILADEKDALPRFRVSFQLYFQEIYDFELHIIDVQAFGLMSGNALEKAQTADFIKASKNTGASSMLMGPDADEGVAVSIFDASDSSHDEGSDDETRRGVNRVSLATVGLKRLSVGIGEAVGVRQAKEADVSKLKRRVALEVQNRSFGSKIRKGTMSVRSEARKVDKGHSSLDRWGNVGRIHYRGTWADLDNDLLHFKFLESKALDPLDTVIAEASVSLRGVAEYGAISGTCSVPDWVVKKARNKAISPDEVKQVMKATVGRFEAKITVENQPKYKQSGELCDMVNDKAYLLVRVLRVDRLALPDQRPINQCDSAVQVQFSGNSYETEVRQDTISPQFNQEFYFELKTNSPAEFSPDELAAMHGPIIFDVWLRSDDDGALSAEHCGHVEVSLKEIFSDGKAEIKTHTSIRTGKEVEYRTAVLKARRRLTCLWTGAGADVNVPASAALPSYLFVDIWLRPFDFSAFSMQASIPSAIKNRNDRAMNESLSAGKDPLVPERVRREWQFRAKNFDENAKNLQQKYWTAPNRGFVFTAQSQNRDEHFLPLFLDVIRPPEILSNTAAVAFWIHCLAHTSLEELKAAIPLWATPDFTLSLGKGDTFAHAILHCSMLRGLPKKSVRPFVCVGTGWDSEPLAWVMTMAEDGSVTFWETATDRSFRLPNRCADAARCRRVVAGTRAPGTQISQELLELERVRRLRVAQQEESLGKLGKMHMDMIDCDPTILRSQEILKILDSQIHPHALVFDSDINPRAQCMQCRKQCEPGKRQGFVCNKKIADISRLGAMGACSTDEKSFLCLTCAERSFPPTEYQPKDNLVKFFDQPILPYKTIDVIFDHTNVWMNLQNFCPNSIYYDLWNSDYWHPFTTVLTTFRSFSLASKGLRKARSSEYYENIRNRILSRVQKSIESVRRNGNLSSFFQRDPLIIGHIERGLELQFKLELVDLLDVNGKPPPARVKLESELQRWKVELYSKIPSNHRFTGHNFLFSFTDAVEISRIILDRIDFLSLNAIGNQFVLACFTGKLPNSVKAAYVYIAIVHPISEDVATKVAEQRKTDETEGVSENVFADEVVERNRLFRQKTVVFEDETDFVSRMRGELYKNQDKTGAVAPVVIFKSFQNAVKAPFNPSNLVGGSRVDVGLSDEEAAVEGGRDYDAEEAEIEQRFRRTMSEKEAFSNPFARLTEVFQQNSDDQIGGLLGNLFSPRVAEEGVEGAAPGGAMEMFSSMWNGQGESGTLVEKKVVKKPPRISAEERKKMIAKQGPVTSPFDRKSALQPTPQELDEIYKPYTVQRNVGRKKFIRHKETGYTIPLPPQEPLRRAVELGAGNLTTQVQVETAHITTVKKKVPPPKDIVYEFNMNLPSEKK